MSAEPVGRFQYTLLTKIEKVISEHSATLALEKLISCGCTREELLFRLLLLHSKTTASNTWQRLIGMERRQIKSATSGLARCAGQVARINRSQVFMLLCQKAPAVWESLYPRIREPGIEGMIAKLPLILCTYEKTLEQCSKEFQPGKRFNLHAAKEEFVKYVCAKTGKPHDREVSAMISAMLDDDNYSPDDHLQWRKRRGLACPRRK